MGADAEERGPREWWWVRDGRWLLLAPSPSGRRVRVSGATDAVPSLARGRAAEPDLTREEARSLWAFLRREGWRRAHPAEVRDAGMTAGHVRKDAR